LTYKQSKENPCLYFSWVENTMIIFVILVDDVMILGLLLLVEHVQRGLENAFTCKQEGKGELTKYICSKINFNCDQTNLGTVKFKHPALVRKLVEEYMLSNGSVSDLSRLEVEILRREKWKWWDVKITCWWLMN
jgi:hypothetical protein